jgi:6-phosphogluconolactonase
MHRVTLSPDNRFLLTNDLGLDAIRVYSVDADSAKIVPYHPAQWNATPGAGPRSLRFHPMRHDLAYLVNELDSTAEVLAWDRRTGTLTSLQRLKLLPDGYSGQTTGSESAISSDGRFAYFANRFYDCIVTCSIDGATGKLTMLGRSATGGRIPRHITLDPSGKWLLIANQESNNVAVFARNQQTGMLGESPQSYPLDSPMCLLFV